MEMTIALFSPGSKCSLRNTCIGPKSHIVYRFAIGVRVSVSHRCVAKSDVIGNILHDIDILAEFSDYIVYTIMNVYTYKSSYDTHNTIGTTTST